MSPSLSREQLEIFFGDCCAIPGAASTGTQEISVSAAELRKLAAYWKSLSPEIRPRLRGITISQGTGKLQLILSASGAASVLVGAEKSEEPFPQFHEIWPYAGWWEDELRGFEGVGFPERRENGGVTWRRS